MVVRACLLCAQPAIAQEGPFAFELSPFDEKLLKFGALFKERFMDIRVSMPVIEALDQCWQTLAECFEPQELLMKQALIDQYFPKGVEEPVE